MKVMTFCISWLNNCLSLSSWRGLAMMARRLDAIVLSRFARGVFDLIKNGYSMLKKGMKRENILLTACAISRKTCR